VANAVLIDTDILIDAGHGIAEAINCLKQQEQKSTLAVSVITQMELMVGCRDKREFQKLEKFLRRFQVIKLDDQASNIAVDLIQRYRLSHGLLIPDALIAATALAYGIPLLTKNQRDYRFISGLQLLPYPPGLSP
jgi:hypothetical protein